MAEQLRTCADCQMELLPECTGHLCGFCEPVISPKTGQPIGPRSHKALWFMRVFDGVSVSELVYQLECHSGAVRTLLQRLGTRYGLTIERRGHTYHYVEPR